MITIYTRTTCAQCKTVKKFFDLKKIAYEVINLDDATNKHHAENLSTLGLISVPITTNKAHTGYVVGFKPMELLKLTNSQA